MATKAFAKWFAVIQEECEIPEILEFCQNQACDYLVIGEGSNTLFVSNLSVLVMANRIGGAGHIIDLFDKSNSFVVKKTKDTKDYSDFRIGAGVNWHQLVEQSLQHNYFGLEHLALIPGLVGAAPIQNIGAYGREIKDVLRSVRAYDTRQQAFVELSSSDCQFAYRDSIFKKNPQRYIISYVTLRLQKKPQTFGLDSVYPALQTCLSKHQIITEHEIFAAVCETRQSKLPSPKHIPNSGSFFKNPIVSKKQHDELQKEFPTLVSFGVPNGVKLAAGWLIEHAGLKGFAFDTGVGCFEKQSLVLVNPDKSGGKEVLDFATHVQTVVKNTFGVRLEIEPRIYSSDESGLICSS